MAASETLHDDRHVSFASREVQHADDACKHTDVVEILKRWIVHFLILLAEHAEERVGPLVESLHEIQALLPAYEYWGYHTREKNQVAGGQYGVFTVISSFEEFHDVTFIIGYH